MFLRRQSFKNGYPHLKKRMVKAEEDDAQKRGGRPDATKKGMLEGEKKTLKMT